MRSPEAASSASALRRRNERRQRHTREREHLEQTQQLDAEPGRADIIVVVVILLRRQGELRFAQERCNDEEARHVRGGAW